MKDNKSASLFQKEQVIESLKQSFVKLNPRMMIKNPIMFTVEVATAVMFFVTLYCKRFTGVVWLQYRCVCHSVCNIAVCQFCRSYRRSAW